MAARHERLAVVSASPSIKDKLYYFPQVNRWGAENQLKPSRHVQPHEIISVVSG